MATVSKFIHSRGRTTKPTATSSPSPTKNHSYRKTPPPLAPFLATQSNNSSTDLPFAQVTANYHQTMQALASSDVSHTDIMNDPVPQMPSASITLQRRDSSKRKSTSPRHHSHPHSASSTLTAISSRQSPLQDTQSPKRRTPDRSLPLNEEHEEKEQEQQRERVESDEHEREREREREREDDLDETITPKRASMYQRPREHLSEYFQGGHNVNSWTGQPSPSQSQGSTLVQPDPEEDEQDLHPDLENDGRESRTGHRADDEDVDPNGGALHTITENLEDENDEEEGTYTPRSPNATIAPPPIQPPHVHDTNPFRNPHPTQTPTKSGPTSHRPHSRPPPPMLPRSRHAATELAMPHGSVLLNAASIDPAAVEAMLASLRRGKTSQFGNLMRATPDQHLDNIFAMNAVSPSIEAQLGFAQGVSVGMGMGIPPPQSPSNASVGGGALHNLLDDPTYSYNLGLHHASIGGVLSPMPQSAVPPLATALDHLEPNEAQDAGRPENPIPPTPYTNVNIAGGGTASNTPGTSIHAHLHEQQSKMQTLSQAKVHARHIPSQGQNSNHHQPPSQHYQSHEAAPNLHPTMRRHPTYPAYPIIPHPIYPATSDHPSQIHPYLHHAYFPPQSAFSDSTLSPTGTPYPPTYYNPFIALNLGGGGGASGEGFSVRSSPRDLPVVLPENSAGGFGRRRLRRRGKVSVEKALRQGAGADERVERGPSTEPRETTPEPDLERDNETTDYGEIHRHRSSHMFSGQNGLNGYQHHDQSDAYEIEDEQEQVGIALGGEEDEVNEPSSEWVDDLPGSEDDELHMEYRLSHLLNPQKRKERWERKWKNLVRAFRDLDCEADTTLLLMASSPHTSEMHALSSRSIRHQRQVPVQLSDIKSLFGSLVQTLPSENLSHALIDALTPSEHASGPQNEQELKYALSGALNSLNQLGRMYSDLERRWHGEMTKLTAEQESVRSLMRQAFGGYLGEEIRGARSTLNGI